MTINNENDLLESLYDYRSEDGNHCHVNKGGNCKGVKLNDIDQDFYDSVTADGHEILDRLLLGHKIGYCRDGEKNPPHHDTCWQKGLPHKDCSFYIMSKGTNLVEELRDAESINSRGKIYLEAADKTKKWVIGSCFAIIIASSFGAFNNGISIWEKMKSKKVNKKEGTLQSPIEVKNMSKHNSNSIGDKNENSAQQAKDNPKAKQTDSKNVLSEKRDEGDRTTNSTDRTSNTKNNTGEKLEQTTREILLYSLPHIPLQSASIEFNIRTNRSKLLWTLPYTKEVSYCESKEKSVE